MSSSSLVQCICLQGSTSWNGKWCIFICVFKLREYIIEQILSVYLFNGVREKVSSLSGVTQSASQTDYGPRQTLEIRLHLAVCLGCKLALHLSANQSEMLR